MLSLLEMSAYGGVMILAVILVRALAMNRLPKAMFLALWALTLARLALPVSLPSPASIWAAAGRLPGLPQRAGVLAADGAQAAALTGAEAAAVPWTALWIGGGLALAVFFLAAHLRARRDYLASLPASDGAILEWMAQNRLRRPVQVRVSDQIASPLTYGVLRPVILLPSALEGGDQQTAAFVLAHEMAHVRRFDALTKWLLAAVLCLHWFNPLVWAMYVLAGRDLELACDEAVVRQYGRGARAPYALALVGMAEQHGGFAPLTSSFSKNALTERITAIMKAKPLTAFGMGAGLMLAAAVAVVFATSAPARQQKAVAESVQPGGIRTLVGDVQAGMTAQAGTAVQAGTDGWWNGYTKAEYDALLAALPGKGYEEMSIAAFNRAVNAALTAGDENGMELYERVLAFLPEGDANEAFLRNTVQASWNEYIARLDEAYSGKRNDPVFRGRAAVSRKREVFGRQVGAEVTADYSFAYRILDQDGLTVAGRDQFLQQAMQAAQKTLEAQVQAGGDEAALRSALAQAGKELTSGKIEFVGYELDGLEVLNDD